MRINKQKLIEEIVNIIDKEEPEKINGVLTYTIKTNGRTFIYNSLKAELTELVPVVPSMLNQKGEPLCKPVKIFSCKIDKYNNLKCSVPKDVVLESAFLSIRSYYIEKMTNGRT